jgi:hypothetical protein
MFDYGEYKDQPLDEKMRMIQALAVEQKRLERIVEEKEVEFKEAKRALADIAENKLPQLMDEIGSADFTTKDGVRILVKEDIKASISDERREEALKWLEEHNFGDLVKREFKIVFGRDEEEWAKEFQASLSESERSLNYEVKRGVHASTLAAFIREQLKEGIDIPLSTFGVFRQRKTTIKVKV